MRDTLDAIARAGIQPMDFLGFCAHIELQACGGLEAPVNMQWQTIAEGKAKDKWERRGC